MSGTTQQGAAEQDSTTREAQADCHQYIQLHSVMRVGPFQLMKPAAQATTDPAKAIKLVFQSTSAMQVPH